MGDQRGARARTFIFLIIASALPLAPELTIEVGHGKVWPEPDMSKRPLHPKCGNAGVISPFVCYGSESDKGCGRERNAVGWVSVT
jgi:hypothetical protein